MARRPHATRPRSRQRPQALTALLVSALIFETLVAVWAFTHFGAGTSSIAVKRFPEWGAEGLMAIAATTAASAWFTLQWRSWAARAVLGGFALQLAWYFLRRPLPDGLPEHLYTVVVLITVGLGGGIALNLRSIWNQLDRG